MADGQRLDMAEFASLFKEFLQKGVADAPVVEAFFPARLSSHFGGPCTKLPIVSESFAVHDHPNVQVAIDSYLGETGRRFELLGVTSDRRRVGLGIGDLATQNSRAAEGVPPREGPVDYANREIGHGRRIACVEYGLYLIHDGELPLAVLVRAGESRGWGAPPGVGVEVMAAERGDAERLLRDIRVRTRDLNVYRGHVVSLSQPSHGPLQVTFHDLPPVARDDIVLPMGVLDRIERQTIRFARLSARLRAAGRHLKRGLLLWGPPGTGKTLTAMYLARQMPERTVLVLTGSTLGLIETSCSMARLLQPATVILEDVDLVAEERSRQGTGANAVLFELLNQMDGLGEDADVLFVLTTNRPELLEPALASRPGRIDQAIEVPLPDAECRSRLLDLYAEGLDLHLTDRSSVLDRTEGVSAAFIKELLRKGALVAAEEDATTEGPITVTDAHLDQALLELTVEGGSLTQTLLGVQQSTARRPSC